MGLNTRKNGEASVPEPGHPLPAVVVAGQVPVAQRRHEVPGPPPPVQVQVLDQERRGDHPDPVVHPALRGELAHPGVDDGVPGPALHPGVEAGVRLVAGVPAHPVELRRSRFCPGAVGVVVQHVGVELPPAQLGPEHRGAGGAQRREVGEQGAGVDLAVLQVHRQLRRAVEVRPVADARRSRRGGVPVGLPGAGGRPSRRPAGRTGRRGRARPAGRRRRPRRTQSTVRGYSARARASRARPRPGRTG